MKSFTELMLSPSIQSAVDELGYTVPSPIQAQTLPILLGDPTDFIGLAATGTGKTAAFAIPLLESIDPRRRGVQGLILCPTRELALQVSGQIDLLGKHKGISALAIYGGAGYEGQLRGLKKGTSIVVGTPGRLVDHIERGTLNLGNIQTVILDEADEMISMGFKEDLETILGSVPEEQRKIWLFSATMSPGVQKVADSFLVNPKRVQVNRNEMLSETVEQIFYVTQESNKPEVLCKLIDAADDFYGLIFFQTKSLVIDAQAYLRERGYKADCLHGDLDQTARERAMKAFRDRRVTLLLCTDVASRGLDVKDLTHVINYSIPRELDSYVHRIGRTARSGKPGLALSLVTPSHRRLVRRIEDMTRSRMIEGVIPTRKDIGAKKIKRILDSFESQTDHQRAIELLSESWKTSLSAMTSEEVAGRFLTLMFPDVFPSSTSSSATASSSAHQQELPSKSGQAFYSEPRSFLGQTGPNRSGSGSVIMTGSRRSGEAPVVRPSRTFNRTPSGPVQSPVSGKPVIIAPLSSPVAAQVTSQATSQVISREATPVSSPECLEAPSQNKPQKKSVTHVEAAKNAISPLFPVSPFGALAKPKGPAPKFKSDRKSDRPFARTWNKGKPAWQGKFSNEKSAKKTKDKFVVEKTPRAHFKDRQNKKKQSLPPADSNPST